MNSLKPLTLNLLRIVTGLLFIPHGYQKLFGDEPVALASLMGVAGVLEFFGGILIVAGLYTRWTAFLLSGQMAVAYWMAHAPRAMWPIENDGERSILFCFIYLFLFAHGGGDWSIDGRLKSRK